MDLVDYKGYPIYDTNILIAFKLGEIDKEVCHSQSCINIADKVEDEFNNLFSNSPQFYDYIDLLDNDCINIINEDIFDRKQKRAIVASLKQFKMSNFFGRKAKYKNEGEFASALYAINLGISVFYTDDYTFVKEYGDEEAFKALKMLSLRSCLIKLFGYTRGKELHKEIKKRNKKFGLLLESEQAAERKAAMLDNFSSRFNIDPNLLKTLPNG